MRVVWAAVLLSSATLSVPALAAPDAPLGTWMTEEGDSKVRISSCGKALCATIVWAKVDGRDGSNPNPALRRRSIVGIDLTTDMAPDGEGAWAGSIYNPENGKTYQATLKRKGERDLEVGGCIMGGLLCGSETWTRQPDDTASAQAVLPPARR